MAIGKKAEKFLDKNAPWLVVIIPVLGIIVYVLNAGGFFNAPPSTSPPEASQQQPAQPQSPALITIDDPTGLPQKVMAGEIVPFSFSIKNPGDAEADYSYKVYVKWNSGEEDVIDENSVSLAAGASTTLAEALKFEVAPATAEVFIEASSGQSVQFALPRTD